METVSQQGGGGTLKEEQQPCQKVEERSIIGRRFPSIYCKHQQFGGNFYGQERPAALIAHKPEVGSFICSFLHTLT